jgi:threonine dehydrogenase-like Zn-dependent dehydrogenase
MSERSKAIRYSELVKPRRSVVVEEAMPSPRPGEVLVEIRACGVCASEFETWASCTSGHPTRLGHEPVGVVREVGSGVRGVVPGDPVTGLLAGAYGQYQIADRDMLVSVPEGVPLESALGEPLACLVNAQRRTPVALADRVAIIGLGFMGLGMLQLLKLRGPSHVVAVDLREEAQEKALELGADEAYHPENLPGEYLLTKWEDWDGPRGLDVIVEGSGTQSGLTLAGQMVRAHGLLSILGFHQGEPRQVDMEMWNWKAIDIVSAHVRRVSDLMECMKIGLDLMAKDLVNLETLITHRYSLEEVDKAYADLSAKPDGFIKALVIP